MKYEPVFGDQSLFDGAPDGAEMVGGLLDRCRLFYKIVGGDLYASFGTHDNFTKEQTTTPKDIKVSAMRRIIAEPKCWTVEDQRAGRLPEVGAEVQFNFYRSAVMRQGVIKYIDDQVAVIQTEDVTRPFCYETCKVVFTPIETPEEKAQREEDEFISSLRGTDIQDRTVNGIFAQGARAAYRKLKGGE